MLLGHMLRSFKAYRKGDVIKIGCCPIPSYFSNWQDCGTLVLAFILLAMLATSPILYCLVGEDADFKDDCKAAEDVSKAYSVLSMVAMILYYVLLMDLAVFNNRVSAYVLVCGRMLSELALCLFALFVTLLTLSC